MHEDENANVAELMASAKGKGAELLGKTYTNAASSVEAASDKVVIVAAGLVKV